MNDRALAKVGSAQLGYAHSEPVFSPEQEQLIRDSFLNGASKQEAVMLLEVSRARRLNPLLKQIHFVKRWDNQKGANVWSAQVSIDGLRAIAERTGKYDGQDEPEFGPMNEHGYPQWAKVKVYRKDWSRPAVGMVYWEEYVQTKKDGAVGKFWDSMPRVMLAKCAESVAMRKAFPEDMSGLYTPEEMMQAETEADPRRGAITAHGDDSDEQTPPNAEVFETLLELLTTIENSIPMCKDYGGCLVLRGQLGSKAKQSELTKGIQVAKEQGHLSPSQHATLSKAWARCHRQVEKLEKELPPPSAEESFVDDAEDFER